MSEFVSTNEYADKAILTGEIGEINLPTWEYLGLSDPPGFYRFRRPIMISKEGTPVAYELRSEPC